MIFNTCVFNLNQELPVDSYDPEDLPDKDEERFYTQVNPQQIPSIYFFPSDSNN